MDFTNATACALAALMHEDTKEGQKLARRIGEAALAGRGFVLWISPADAAPHPQTGYRRPARIMDAFADRQTCEATMSRQVWSTVEAARGRSLAEACKIHGFDIVEVPPAPGQVWLVQADHWAVPGRPCFAYTSEAAANTRAAQLVNDLIIEAVGEGGVLDGRADLTAFADATTWPAYLLRLQRAIEAAASGEEPGDDFDPGESDVSVWINTAPLNA